MLGVSQKAVETEYYMVDLPKLVEKKMKFDAVKRLGELQFVLASNNRSFEEAEYRKYVKQLSNQAGIKSETNFDRDKFEQLRALTKGG